MLLSMKPNILTAVLISSLLGQTTLNPDFSVIGDLIINVTEKETKFDDSGLELAIQGNVNPYARADVYIHKHGGDEPIELEEVVLSIERGLPWGLGLRTGLFRPDFGKINPQHRHTYFHILESLPVQETLGDEMWSGLGAEARIFIPLPWYSNLSVGIFENGIVEHGHEENHEALDEEDTQGHIDEDSKDHRAISSRFSQFFDLNQLTHLELGTSYYQEIVNGGKSIFGTDFKFRWRPDTYRSFTWQTDVFYTSFENKKKYTSGYTWINYQFRRIWNIGLIGDYSDNIDGSAYSSFGVFAGFSPVEESSVLRIRLHRSNVKVEDSSWSIVAQLIWSLGPHKPHIY
jgi:hypothetical protein